ncbi:hypothetical protein HB364_05500 [Pseudoflavitalea sp. X16]|uniref:kelch repeat-containing protein n=1 Tax=Paraflavitalea devenefica TaxID=2716334 RepID=UPI00141E41A2|nr:kelch repeat-containing protein [Paraflavitalea devenefica]NII24522.1 hypothetical protein [Paraflavitalea devenefica]
MWQYNPVKDIWTKKADYPGTPVDVATSFVINGKGYVAGGNQVFGTSKALWEYDPVTDKWTERKNMPVATSGSVGFAIKNKGYVGVGWGGGNQIWEYNPASDAWKMYTHFEGGHREGAMGVVVNNIAYIGLGTTTWTVYPTQIWEFSPR